MRSPPDAEATSTDAACRTSTTRSGNGPSLASSKIWGRWNPSTAALPPPPIPESVPGTPLQFGFLATHLLNGTLTAPIAVRLIGDQAVRIPPETLEALGIRVEFEKKTTVPSLAFLLWRSPPSSPLHPARAARRRGRSSTGATRPTSSPSRDGSA